MDKKQLLIMARDIKNAMTTAAAGCYRVKALPRTATITAIYNILSARISGDWSAVLASDLYKNQSSIYCNILAYSYSVQSPLLADV